jgi:hypothetical protein
MVMCVCVCDASRDVRVWFGLVNEDARESEGGGERVRENLDLDGCARESTQKTDRVWV